ncbi:hypothetical protein [Micromonospora chersina]|uniref:hypothetical protein n=1 Tax=Micromonospora chersina TaxID=47854 RepID=UPI0037164460
MKTMPPKPAAQQRMTPDNHAVTRLVDYFVARSPSQVNSYLTGCYPESIRAIHEAHLIDCAAGDDQDCGTCRAIRVGLTTLLAEERWWEVISRGGR